ncbi:hypothetical protein PCIT_a2614 [Pseudoalteromonas citrea]|uniref:Uncharacterized protein n=1 Tax=Pseudoalteromonas citrea TaxID=43655 RepID=A0AAD4AHA4_9GAMM|nr:hypothetical protein PCIT_a2614 [Pseudoalteromonas citrea]
MNLANPPPPELIVFHLQPSTNELAAELAELNQQINLLKCLG